MSFSRTNSGSEEEQPTQFSRTLPGIIARCLLYPKKTIVHVEGETDKAFYDEILQKYNCRIEARNGKKQCEELAEVLAHHNYPYVVILDGDYEILERTRSKHRRVILLHRHSFENYLFEEKPIEQFCWDLTHLENRVKKLASRFQEVIENTELKFKELIVLDVAHQRSHTGCNVLPNKPDQFLERGRSVDVLDDKIQQRCVEAAQCIDRQSVENARIVIEEFLREASFH